MSEVTINSKSKLFGTMPDGEAVYSYELKNSKGVEVNIINYGATITSLKIPLKTVGFINFTKEINFINRLYQTFFIGINK